MEFGCTCARHAAQMLDIFDELEDFLKLGSYGSN